MYAINPLEDESRLGNPDLALPISFFYGDIDWMDYRGGERVMSKNAFHRSLSNMYIIENSDHHMYLDNPEEFAERIIRDINDTLDRKEYL